jgi:hypothetical protein
VHHSNSFLNAEPNSRALDYTLIIKEILTETAIFASEILEWMSYRQQGQLIIIQGN